MNEKNISSGNLLFRGHKNQLVREEIIGWPLVQKILKQISSFCDELPDDEMYCLSWIIQSGKITSNSLDDRMSDERIETIPETGSPGVLERT